MQSLRRNVSLDDIFKNLKKLEAYSDALIATNKEKHDLQSKVENEIAQLEKKLIELKLQLNELNSTNKQILELQHNISAVLSLKVSVCLELFLKASMATYLLFVFSN